VHGVPLSVHRPFQGYVGLLLSACGAFSSVHGAMSVRGWCARPCLSVLWAFLECIFECIWMVCSGAALV